MITQNSFQKYIYTYVYIFLILNMRLNRKRTLTSDHSNLIRKIKFFWKIFKFLYIDFLFLENFISVNMALERKGQSKIIRILLNIYLNVKRALISLLNTIQNCLNFT